MSRRSRREPPSGSAASGGVVRIENHDRMYRDVTVEVALDVVLSPTGIDVLA